MSDLSLLDLDSPKNLLSNEKRLSSVISSKGGSNTSDKDEVPVHLFLSPAHSDSAHSFSSHSKNLKEQKREKRTEETSFSFTKERKLKVSTNPNDDADIVLSSPNHSQDYNSSESEDSFSNKIKSFSDSSTKTKTKFRSKKVHNFTTSKVSNKWEKEEIEMDNKSNISEAKKKEHLNVSDIFNSSADNEIRKSVIPASDLSYREKIRDRFNAMKEKAVETLSRPQSRTQSRSKLKTLISKQRGGGGGQIIENILKLEENEIIQALEKHKKIKERWKEAYKASLEKKHELNDKYNNFFCENEKIQLKIISSEEDTKSLSNFEKKENDQIHSKVLTSEFLGFKDDWDLTEFVEPKSCDSKSLKLWEETLFYPSSRPVSIEHKLETGLNPRYLEDEGIYVGKKINVPNRLKNKLEQRLLKIPEGRKWFGKDGELILSSCSLKSVPSHSYLDDDSFKISEQLVWKEPTISDLNYRYMDLSENMNYVLDIDIHSIEFSHHPLFSREHVLAQRFKELFVKYQKRKKIDNLNRLTRRLNALRKTRDNLKDILLAGGDNFDISNKLERYEKDIKEVRKMRYVEGQIDKQLTSKIIMTWKDLVKLREYQGYQTTSIKLKIKKNSIIDLEAEKAKWISDIKKDTKETIEELNSEYKKKFEEYTKEHQLWLQKKSKKVKEEKEDSDGVEESTSEDEDSTEEPKPPEPVVSTKVKAEITEIYKESFRCPGEPELEFTLSSDTKMEGTVYNNKEELRRSAVKRCLIFLKLFYNGKEVCRTESYPLNQKFSVAVSQRFAVRILEWPESLMLEIHEETGTFNKNLLVPGIYLPFPDSLTTIENSDVINYEFSSKIIASFNHSGVGSGCKIIPYPDGSELNNKPLCLFTSGTVACRLGWVCDQAKILAPPEKYWNFIRDDATTNLSEILLSNGTIDMEKLKEWAQKSNLDQYDPCNSAFFHFLDNTEEIEKTKVSYFRLNSLMDEFDFCKEKDIDNNIRLKLLRLRDMEEPEFAEAKMVPLNEKEINKDIFIEYKKRQSAPDALTDILSTDPLDGHRLWGRKFLEQVQQRLLQQCRLTKRTKRYHDIIMEDNIPDFGTLGLTIMKGLRPKRPLHPERKSRKKITPRNLMSQDIKIIVNVVRAFEVPVRKDIDGMSAENSIDGFSLVNVRPFVEISFQGITARTTSAEGANPTWNQDLQIPLRNKNGYLPGGPFHFMKDTIYLHLFDERVIDLVEDDSIRETNIHQRLEKHWLASMEIPFFTLYFNSKIEGTFKLYSPPVLLGYEREAHRLHVSGSTDQNPKLPQRDATYITLFVTVQPALNPPKPIQEKMECNEPLNLEKHLENWQKEVMTAFPHRKIKTLVLDITGKSVCVTRFVKPLPLPPIVENKKENTTLEMIARFVAMIPLIGEGTIFSGFFDFWLTADQIHRLLLGDSEDHAVLLCCYFLELGLESYILLGSGIPHGSTAYVFVRETKNKKSEYFVWDATNGQKFNIKDSFCPLQKIYCLINDQNIWANIQAEESPRRTKFDLSKRADWFPAFGKNISAPTASVQPQNLEYKLTSKQAVDLLQDKLEKKLRDSIMKWRTKSRTQWNRYCAATLRKLLPDLEHSSWNNEKDTPDHIIQLQHILASHKVCGFPINMAYTNIDAVIEAVKATRVHCKEGEGVEFALAAYIHAYPNDILSVWVYVASLVRRR